MDRRTLSQTTNSLIIRLNEPRPWLDLLRRRDDLRPQILDQIARTGEPAAIPWIISHVVEGDVALRRAAAIATAKLMEKVGPYDVVWFNEHIRTSWHVWHRSPSPWHSLKATRLRKLKFERSGDPTRRISSCLPGRRLHNRPCKGRFFRSRPNCRGSCIQPDIRKQAAGYT